jgi:hypothetical protein
LNPHKIFKGAVASWNKTFFIAFLLVTSHIVIIAGFRSRIWEPFTSGAFELVSAVFAVAVCYRAGRRQDFARLFWFLLGATFTLWSVGQALYLFNQFYLLSLNLTPNILLFLFFTSAVPFCMAILHRTQHESVGPEWLRWFDGAQIVGIVLAACLLNFDLVTGKAGFQQLEARLLTMHARNVILAVALVARALASKGKARQLYAPVSFAFSFFTLSTWLGNRALELGGMKTGDWCDLSWSVPFAIFAIAARQWPESRSVVAETQLISHRSSTLASRLGEYFVPFILSVFLVVLALKGMAMQRDIAATLIVVSLLCVFARTSAAQCYRDGLLIQLRTLLENTKRLTGYLPICAACKMIRDEDFGGWRQLESYIREYTEAEFTHGICPDCAHRLYPEHVKST